MGRFAFISAFVNRDKATVTNALSEYAQSCNGIFERGSKDPEIEETIIHGGCDVAAITFGRDAGDPDLITAEIARILDTWGIYFHIHDGDLWLYVLYQSGEEVEEFSVRPEYFGDPDATTSQAPPQRIFDAFPSADPVKIERYLLPWTPELEGQKANPTDNYEYHDCMQLLDFINALGIQYPHPLDGDAYLFLDGEYHRDCLSRMRECNAPRAIISNLEKIVSKLPLNGYKADEP